MNADMVAAFADGTPAVQVVQVGKGKLYLFGFSLGYSYYAEQSNAYLSFMDGVLQDAGAKKYRYANCAEGIYEKRLQKDDKEILFLFNNGETDKTFALDGEIITVGGDGSRRGNTLQVKANGMAYAVIKK